MLPSVSRNMKGIPYITLSFLFWLSVEFVTVWHAKFAQWLTHFPYVLLQYLGIVLIFWFFLYQRRWSEKKVFVLMLVVMYVFEVLWQNPLLSSVLRFVPGSILLASIWGFLVFMPQWLIEGSLRQHKPQAAFYSLWILVALTLGIAGLFN